MRRGAAGRPGARRTQSVPHSGGDCGPARMTVDPSLSVDPGALYDFFTSDINAVNSIAAIGAQVGAGCSVGW